MEKIESKNIPLLSCFLIMWLSLLPADSYSQIYNGSFEYEGQFSVEGWKFTDTYCYDSSQDTPSEGGDWSLQLAMLNIQGGPWGLAYQVIPQVQNGDIWQLNAWVKQPMNRRGYSSIYYCTTTKIDNIWYPPDPLQYGNVDTTSANYWTRLSVIDTIYIEESDSICVVLDAGWTSGPTHLHDFSYFDLVSVEKIGEVVVSTNNFNYLNPDNYILFQNYPNPFNPKTTIEFDLPKTSEVTLKIFNILGEEVATLVSDWLNAGRYTYEWSRPAGIASGIYLYSLHAGEYIETRKMVYMK